jgi:hypothetical protein
MTDATSTQQPLTTISSLEQSAARLRGWLEIPLLLLLAVYAWTVIVAPIDNVQGVIQKILYVHPPLAYGAYLGFIITAIGGGLYLWSDREEFDRLAIAAIPLNYYIIEIFDKRSMHPDNLERGSLGAGMGLPFLMGNLALFFIFAYFVLLRWEIESLRTRVAREEAEGMAVEEEGP